MSTAPCVFCGSDYPVHHAACPACGMDQAAPTRALPPGTTLQDGCFTVGRVLGEGGFSITYQGVHKPPQRVVAIKELFPPDAQRQDTRVLVPQARQLAYRQAMAAALQEAHHIVQLQAPGIVDVFDAFWENGTIYIVMEYLEGQTLLDRIRAQGPLPPATVHDLALEICDALAVLHAQQLLHRDLKPANLLLTGDGRTVLIDFGSVWSYQTDRTVQHTQILPVAYAAPEQYSERSRFGPYTDIFALGATLYHTLTGAPPPQAIERLQDPGLVPQWPVGIGPEWVVALNQALRLPIQERPQTVAAFRKLLSGDVSRASPVPGTVALGLLGNRDLAPGTGVSLLGSRSQRPVLLASGSRDGTVRLWDGASGQCQHTLEHGDIVFTVAFSPDGHTLASGSGDGTVRLWDVASGQCRHTLMGHEGIVWTVAFSPDGHTLASGAHDETVWLWNVTSGQCRHTLEHGDIVFTVAFSPDGHTLTSEGEDSAVRLWDVASGQGRHMLVGHEDRVWAVAFSPDGHTLASVGWDGVQLWDVASGQGRHTLGGGGTAHTVAFSPDGHTLAGGSWDGTVRLWDVASGQGRHTLVGHEEKGVWTVAFSPDGHTLVSRGLDNTVRLWDVASGQGRHTLVGQDVAFSPDGHTLASGGDDGTVRLWEVTSGQCRRTLKGHEDTVFAMAFSLQPSRPTTPPAEEVDDFDDDDIYVSF